MIESDHPLTQTFAKMRRVGDHLRMALVADSQLHDPRALFSAESPHLMAFVADAQATLCTAAPPIVTSSLLQRYSWGVVVFALGSYLIDQRVPLLSLDNLRVANTHGGNYVECVTGRFAALPNDPAADHPDALILPDDAALQTHLRQSLETHFAWVIAQITQQIGGKPKGLWLTVADRCAGVLIWLMQTLDPLVSAEKIECELDALLHVPNSPLNHEQVGLFTLTHETKTKAFLDRATCCYWYKMEAGGTCDSCPRLPKPERNARLLNGWIGSIS